MVCFPRPWVRRDNRNELTSKFDFDLNPKDKLSATIGLNRAGDPYYGTLNPAPDRQCPGLPCHE